MSKISKRLSELERRAATRRADTPAGPKTEAEQCQAVALIIGQTLAAGRIVEGPAGEYTPADPDDYAGRTMASLLGALGVIYGDVAAAA